MTTNPNPESAPQLPLEAPGPLHEVVQYLTAAETDVPKSIQQIAEHIAADPELVQPALEAAGGLQKDTVASRLGTLIGEAHVLKGYATQRYEERPLQPYRRVDEEAYNSAMRKRRTSS